VTGVQTCALPISLAVVAYRQPATKPDVDEIRGVDSGSAIKLLLDRNLVRVLGRKEEPGRPLLYGTTQAFLEFFGLASLSDLPSLREYTELTDDGKRQLERDLFARPVEPLQEYLEQTTVPARARRWDDLVEVLGDDLGGLPEGVSIEAEADVRCPMSEADVRSPMSEAEARGETEAEADGPGPSPKPQAPSPADEEEDE
jgi:segregation and condensation protein B